MTNNQKAVRDWMIAFGQETPEKPTIPSVEIRKLRAKLILEEALETIEALGFAVQMDPSGKYLYVTPISCELKAFIDEEPNLKDIADGLSDLSVVNYGTLVACGLLKKTNQIGDTPSVAFFNDPLFDEAMRSNWTKLWSNSEISAHFGCRVLDNLQVACKEGGYFAKRINENQWLVKDKDGKVIKSPSYSPANLQSIIDAL